MKKITLEVEDRAFESFDELDNDEKIEIGAWFSSLLAPSGRDKSIVAIEMFERDMPKPLVSKVVGLVDDLLDPIKEAVEGRKIRH